jgi:putative tryptophan/tyrosine transport system substrate-binding protein
MRRRDFITLLGGAAVAKPFAARAQEPSRIYRLGSLFGSQRTAPYHVAIFEALRQSGFVDGQNLLADPHGYGLRVDQVAAHAVEVVDARVDVILCTGDVAIRAAQQATKTIPILASTEDMVGSGFVHSLAKPDGNVTGVSSFTPELDGKRQEILLEAVPGIRRMAVLADANTTSSQRLQALKDAASTRAIELLVYPVRKPEEIASAIDAASRSCLITARSSSNAFRYSVCQPYISSRTLRMKVASSAMALGSYRCFETCIHGNSSRCCGGQKSPKFLSSSRPRSICSLISKPPTHSG